MIRLEGASFAVRDASGSPRTLLHPTDLTLEPGDRSLVLGANGSGKTTLLRLMAGLAAPTAGAVLVDGAPVAASGPDHEASTLWPRVAVIFEEPDPQFLADTVESEIAFGLESMALAPAETRARVAEALEAHGLLALAARDPRTLSAGEKTRTLLAAALAARPSALLLDQCFAHLDPATRRAEEERIAGMARGGTLGILRASQDLDPPMPGERIHLIEAGRLHGLSGMRPASVLAARAAPLPLALRASAALAVEGRWSGALVATAEEFLAALDLDRAVAVTSSGYTGASRAVSGPPGPGPSMGPRSDRARAISASATMDPAVSRREAPLLTLENVSWSPVRGAAPVVEGVSLAVAPGEAVALVGASGSGKTTLLHLAAGLREVSSGRVERAVPSVKRVPPVMLALEYPERQLFARTVAEDAAAALWIEGVPAGERARRAERALREVDLDPERFADRAPGTLSEGEKRRAALASFLIEPPLVLLWDEPTAGLDPEGRRALRTALARLRDRGRAILFASHDLDFVSAVADRVLVMGREPDGPGRLLGAGAPEAVWDDAALLAKARLPVPEFHALARELRERGCLPPGCVRDGDALIAALSRSSAPLTW